jgi:glycosyltransferase involved in cell wall biosynthesis
MSIDLFLLGGSQSYSSWRLGQIWPVEMSTVALHERVLKALQSTSAEAFLFWDASLGEPNAHRVENSLLNRGGIWHSGLCLGMSGLPGMIDFVSPTWMLNCDSDPSSESTSWRLSLRTALVRTDIIKKMGFISPEFGTLEAAALDMGHRYITRGVMLRHLPSLVPNDITPVRPKLPIEDELRFVLRRYGPFWMRWAFMRAMLTGYASLTELQAAYRKLEKISETREPDPYEYTYSSHSVQQNPRVTVLVPTLNRYSYLRTLLSQLNLQTVRPLEIIVVDQTPEHRRDVAIQQDFKDLPVRFIFRKESGQCSSRNAGLQQASGEYILFLDDDDEIPPTLIESHLQSLKRFQAEVSSGVAEEVGAGPLPENFKYLRMSDVFPTNNSLIHHSVLYKSGLFDLAYEKGQRADGDLGMRIYLSGALMILNPEVSVLHHHAPQGGLREHKARVITYASSRQRLTHRQLPSVTEIYLARRYFDSRQLREMLWLRVLGTFSVRGGTIRKILKVIISGFCLPDTIFTIWSRKRKAEKMLGEFPKIPNFRTPAIPVER